VVTPKHGPERVKNTTAKTTELPYIVAEKRWFVPLFFTIDTIFSSTFLSCQGRVLIDNKNYEAYLMKNSFLGLFRQSR
jgi:hypothetical protein